MNEEYKNFLKTANKKQITPHFNMYEVCFSQTALQKNIDNRPNNQILINATALCKNILEKVREHYNKPIIVHSIYRCGQLNIAVGGVKTSQHCTGQAVDFTIDGINDLDIVNWIRNNLIFDQIILEKVGNTHWVHCSFSLTHNRKQCLKFDGYKYISF